jgi:hypothetical protein
MHAREKGSAQRSGDLVCSNLALAPKPGQTSPDFPTPGPRNRAWFSSAGRKKPHARGCDCPAPCRRAFQSRLGARPEPDLRREGGAEKEIYGGRQECSQWAG